MGRPPQVGHTSIEETRLEQLKTDTGQLWAFQMTKLVFAADRSAITQLVAQKKKAQNNEE